MKTRLFPVIGGCLAAWTVLLAVATPAPATDEKPGVKGDYKRPAVVIPYAYTKPKIDGVVDDAEWQSAASVNALQTVRHQISVRQTRFWFCWDEENLYVAMRSPLRPGERVVQNLRDRGRETNVVFDDSYEIWLDVGAKDPKTGLDCFYQFLCNYAGARYDSLQLPAVGNSRIGFDTGWDPKNRITPDGKAWEWELVIPRQSIYKDTPFTDGFAFTCLIARNYKRPWEQNSFEGTSSFSVRETHSRFELSKKAPAVHLLSVGDADANSIGLSLAAFGQEDGKLKYRFASDGGAVKEGELDVKKGQFTAIQPDLAIEKLDPKPTGDFRVTVTTAGGEVTLLDWCAQRAFGHTKGMPSKLDDRGDVVGLTLQFNPVHDYLRVTGDFIQFDDRDKIKKVHVQVAGADGKGELGSQDFQIDADAYVQGIIQLRDVPTGKYAATLTCFDAAGKPVAIGKDADGKPVTSRRSEFEKLDPAKAFAWWHTKHGNIEKAIAPWTPVTYDKGAFGVWGRTMKPGTAGLPAQVTTQGKDLLAAPARLEAVLPDGKTVAAVPNPTPGKLDRVGEHRVILDSSASLAGLGVQTKTTVEFDGMYKVEMTLTPPQGKSVKVKALKVVVPYANAAAEYVHAVGEGIRTGFYYGFLPAQGTGRIWTCKTVDSQPMVVGSFIPYLWIGSTHGGLCWFADSDEGWVPDEDTPAIEVRRDGEQSTALVLNLVSREFTIDAPRKIVFAFQASPVKQMHDAWRSSKWWCGDTFYDFAFCGSTIWQAIPFPTNVEKSKAMVAQVHKQGKLAVPYFIHQTLPGNLVPEMRYFGDEWRTSISECLYYGPTLTDYMVHNYAEWAKSCDIDGYYVDNMRPVACDNIHAGRGYRLSDGRVQPTYQMFDTRRYFLRMRAAFAEQGKSGNMVLHMTNCMIIPWVGPADIAYDGEHHVIYPEMQKDFMDFWSLERMRVDFPGQWGTAVNFMSEFQGNWPKPQLLKAWRSYVGMVGLHDALPTGNDGMHYGAAWKQAREKFGINDADVKFLGYWNADSGVKADGKDVYAAAWVKPGKVLLLVANLGEAATAKVTLDPAKLHLADPGRWTVSDPEAGVKVTSYDPATKTRPVVWDADTQKPLQQQGNTIVVPIERHDYRHVLIEVK